MQFRPHYDRPDSLISEYVGAVVVATEESYPHWGCDVKSMYPTNLHYTYAMYDYVRKQQTMERQLIPFDDA